MQYRPNTYSDKLCSLLLILLLLLLLLLVVVVAVVVVVEEVVLWRCGRLQLVMLYWCYLLCVGVSIYH